MSDESLPSRDHSLAPGILLCAALTVASLVLQRLEERLVGQAIIEAIVIAILLGMIVRTSRPPGERFAPGIAFSAKQLLELAVFLLGASVNLPELLRAGPALLVCIVAIVAIALGLGYAIGRMLGLPAKLAILVACGNAICGNSAIAAVAPVIGARARDVASAIAFTAVLGVVMVIGLPLLIGPLALSHYQYGVLAGMSVYAVPQVLAATFPVSALSGEVGTLVKLVRVLMLGPVVLFFSVVARRDANREPSTDRLTITTLIPWFIVGFVVLAALRSMGIVPATIAGPVRDLSRILTIVAMAALGLGVDVRAVARAGFRVSLTVVLSLAAIVLMSIGMIALLAVR
jgi:uncharacterized integral membrane protein (TIGR00698 family)